MKKCVSNEHIEKLRKTLQSKLDRSFVERSKTIFFFAPFAYILGVRPQVPTLVCLFVYHVLFLMIRPYNAILIPFFVFLVYCLVRCFVCYATTRLTHVFEKTSIIVYFISLLLLIIPFCACDIMIRTSSDCTFSIKIVPVADHRDNATIKNNLDNLHENKDYVRYLLNEKSKVPKFAIILFVPLRFDVPLKKRTVNATSTETRRLDFLRHGQQSHFFLKRSPKSLVET